MTDARILVVDDQPLVAQTCADILAGEGYRVHAACMENAIEALRAGARNFLSSPSIRSKSMRRPGRAGSRTASIPQPLDEHALARAICRALAERQGEPGE